MSGKIKLLFLMLLVPLTIGAQVDVVFDFSTASSGKTVPPTMEKDGICLRFSAKKDGVPAVYTVDKKAKCLKLNVEGVLAVNGANRKITAVRFILTDKNDNLDFYKEKVGKITRKTSNSISEIVWSGEANSVAFTPHNTHGLHVKSIKVSYEETPPDDVRVRVSSVGRATLYYGDRSLKVAEGIVACTYKIDGNRLFRNKVYVAGDVVPKGTAVVLEGKEGDYLFEATKEKGMHDADNALRGSDKTSMTDGGGVYYVFAKGSKGVGFYWKNPGGKAFQTEAHKAYLVYSPSVASQAKSFLGFDIPSGIQSFRMRDADGQHAPACNLAGQQVGRDCKGIVIVNGKKYLNR